MTGFVCFTINDHLSSTTEVVSTLMGPYFGIVTAEITS
jgi:hypothetical protein